MSRHTRGGQMSTERGRGRKSAKKCHVLFQWSLINQKDVYYFVRTNHYLFWGKMGVGSTIYALTCFHVLIIKKILSFRNKYLKIIKRYLVPNNLQRVVHLWRHCTGGWGQRFCDENPKICDDRDVQQTAWRKLRTTTNSTFT